jgi:hypothetical protein
LTPRIDVRVVLFDEMRLQPRNVEVVHEIVAHVRIDRTAVARIEDGALHQRHADAADHPAGALARGEAGIDDATDAVGAKCAAHPYGADVWIDCKLSKDGAKRVHRIAARHLGIALRGAARLDWLASARRDVSIGLTRRGVAAATKAPSFHSTASSGAPNTGER